MTTVAVMGFDAQEYLKLRQLGVSENPGKTMKYLVKTHQIRSTKIAGRLAFRKRSVTR